MELGGSPLTAGLEHPSGSPSALHGSMLMAGLVTGEGQVLTNFLPVCALQPVSDVWVPDTLTPTCVTGV